MANRGRWRNVLRLHGVEPSKLSKSLVASVPKASKIWATMALELPFKT